MAASEPEAPASRHRRVAGAFTVLVEETGDWDAPAPVAGWTARDVVAHLVGWLPGLLHGGSPVRLPAVPDPADDPAGAWTEHAAAVQAVLDDPAQAGATLTNPHLGELAVAEAIDRFYTTDVLLHSWDLARAGGRPSGIDEAEAAALLAGMEPMDEMLRASGQYGARVPVPETASAVDRLMGFIGRDPSP